MIRPATAVAVLLGVGVACSNLSKKEKPHVETKDAARVANGGTSAVVAVSEEHIRKLFIDAAACTTPCPARDELRARMTTTPAQVAMAAFAIMADPASRTDQGVGQEAVLFVDDWLKSGPDDDARRRASAALERVVTGGSAFMRLRAYDYLSFYRLPDAQRILVAEVENAARSVGERGSAGRALGGVIDDFAFIRAWLEDEQPLHWFAALSAMRTFDPDGNDRRWQEERALTIALGKRATLPGEVVYELAFYYGLYLEDKPDDAEVRASAERWVAHSDDMAAAQMRKVLTAYTSWRRP